MTTVFIDDDDDDDDFEDDDKEDSAGIIVKYNMNTTCKILSIVLLLVLICDYHDE